MAGRGGRGSRRHTRSTRPCRARLGPRAGVEAGPVSPDYHRSEGESLEREETMMRGNRGMRKGERERRERERRKERKGGVRKE